MVGPYHPEIKFGLNDQEADQDKLKPEAERQRILTECLESTYARFDNEATDKRNKEETTEKERAEIRTALVTLYHREYERLSLNKSADYLASFLMKKKLSGIRKSKS